MRSSLVLERAVAAVEEQGAGRVGDPLHQLQWRRVGRVHMQDVRRRVYVEVVLGSGDPGIDRIPGNPQVRRLASEATEPGRRVVEDAACAQRVVVDREVCDHARHGAARDEADATLHVVRGRSANRQDLVEACPVVRGAHVQHAVDVEVRAGAVAHDRDVVRLADGYRVGRGERPRRHARRVQRLADDQLARRVDLHEVDPA